ncbi:MAG: Holliday junction resolvase RuvX [Clostridia bacterium]|nr:Holliday junction resolvase RuvX [Clostridia bacterium]
MKKMCLDIGTVRIGIAFSDELNILATGFDVYKRKNSDADFEYFSNLATEKKCDEIIIGYPINMDGTKGDKILEIENFANMLKEKTTIPIKFWDERLTTVEAEEYLIEAGYRREERRKIIDKVAAQIILQSFLDSNINK